MSKADKIPLVPPSHDELKAAIRIIALGLLVQGNTFAEASVFADGILYKVRVELSELVE